MQLSAPPNSSFNAMSESPSASVLPSSASSSSALPSAGDTAKEPSTLKPLFKHIRRMICLRNVGRPGFVPRDLNRQDRILEAMSTTLREYRLEIERLTKEIHTKQATRRTTHSHSNSHSHSHSHSSVKTRLNKPTPAVTAAVTAASLDPRHVHRATVVSQSGASSALSLSLAAPTKDVSLVSSRPPFLPLASSSSSTSLLSHPQDPSPSSSSSTTAPVPAPSPSDSSSASNLSLGLPPLNHTFSRLFLDSDIPRAIFSPSLRVLESNERFVMSPVFNAISRADLMGRRLSVYAFYDPACADDLLGSTTQLQRGETLELLLLLTSTRPMAPALQLRVVAYPSYKPSTSGSSPSHHTRSRSEVPVVEHFHLVVTHCEKVQTPPHLQAPTQFLHHPGVEYIVRSSQTRVAMRPDTLSSPPNPTIHTTVSSSMLLSSHSTVVSSHISTPLAFVPQQQNPNILPLLPLPPAVAPTHSFFTTISSTTHNHNHRTPLALERASSFDSAYKSRSVDISLSPALWPAAAPSSSTARALAGAGPTKEQSSMFATALSSGAVSSMMSPSSQSVVPPPLPSTSTSTVDWSRFFSESHPNASTSDMGMGVGDYPFPFSPTPAEAAGDMHHMFPPGASPSLFSPLYNPILPTPSTAAGPPPPSSTSWLPGAESVTVRDMHVGVDTAPSTTASSSDVLALPLSRFSSSASLSAPSSDPATALSVAASSSSAISDLLKSHGVSTGSQLFDLLLSSHSTALEMDESEFRAFVSSSTLAVL